MLRKNLLAGATAIAATALLAATAAPASAADDSTAVTFALDAGALAVSTAASATLGAPGQWDVAALGQTITGSLGATQVEDGRGTNVNWSVSVTSTTFQNVERDGQGAVVLRDEQGAPDPVDGEPTVLTESEGVRYISGDVTVLTGEVTPDEEAAEETPVQGGAAGIFAGTGVVGVNSASWTPSIEVDLPDSALAGRYDGTVTTSVV